MALSDLLSSSRAGYWGGPPGVEEVDVHVVRNGDIKPGVGVLWSELPRRSMNNKQVQQSRLQVGDVLITTSGECGTTAFVDREPEQVTCSSNFVRVLRADAGLVDPRYLFHYSRTSAFREALRPHIRGTALQNLSTRDAFAAAEVPLPTLDVQRRIAAILDQADALRAKRGEVLARCEEMRLSIFVAMFGARGSHLSGSERLSLGELLHLKSGAFLPARQQRPGPFPIFGGNGINGYHDTFLFEEPRIVIGRVGAYCGVTHMTPGRAWVTDNALYVAETRRPCSLEYLRDALSIANLNQYASRSGQPLISAGRIKGVNLAVPSRAAQEMFSSRVRQLVALRDQHERAQEKEAALWTSLQLAFFRRL